jgi:hypothetical protein
VSNVTSCLLLVAMLLGAACSTPQIAMDHANNGVRLTQQLQDELARYSQSAKLAAERRMAVMQRMEGSALENDRDRAMDDYLDQTSGRSTTWMASARRLDESTRKYASLLVEEDKARKEVADRLAAVVKALPTPGEKLGAVQKALADLGTELSAAERFAIVSRFLEEGKAIVKKNADAAASAASAAAITPTP